MPTPPRLQPRRHRRAGLVAPTALIAALALTTPSRADGDGGLRVFREAVEPVLVRACYRCHSAQAEKVKGGLRLDSREAVLGGGDSGPAVVPGKSGESPLIQAIRHEDGLEMPPKSPPLPAEVVAGFVKWVDAGAAMPEPAAPAGPARSAVEQARGHWAFRPVRAVAAPAVKDAAWVETPVDAFVLAALEARGWSPAPDATKAEWLRRVTFDLTGLPPTPEEVAAFEADPDPRAREAVVDRLLSRPSYGERWAQHWLDVVRYAETEGYEYDRAIPDAWRFRDYVVASLNRDKPFDRFLTEQVAGDELAPGDPECQTASAFHRLGPVRRNAGNPDIALSRNEVLTERTDVLGTAVLGLTVGCARCHNHKLEPITQKDYYRLQAYLAATEEGDVVLLPPSEKAAWEAKTKALKAEMLALQNKAREAVGPEKDRLTAEAKEIEAKIPAQPPTIPATRNDFETRTPVHVLKRGDWEAKGDPVGPRPPSVLVADDLPELPADVPDPRTRLARWLTDPAHPLTARVIVNRVWQHHFGAGLVRTVNDFGTKGERPSHPELLDRLAADLVAQGWRLKPLHRMIVLSHAYRQSSRNPSASQAAEADPENRDLWHFTRRRLTAEEVRDAMLAASGRLNPKAGGPSVVVRVDRELTRLLYRPSQWQVTPDPAEHDRRSIYLVARRNLRLPFMEAFDAPPLLSSCARRESSTHAPQALELLNGTLSNDLAGSFALRLDRECGGDPAAEVDRAFRLALGRPPTDAERALSLEYLREGTLKEFALAVFNLNGFLYVP